MGAWVLGNCNSSAGVGQEYDYWVLGQWTLREVCKAMHGDCASSRGAIKSTGTYSEIHGKQ